MFLALVRLLVDRAFLVISVECKSVNRGRFFTLRIGRLNAKRKLGSVQRKG
jgi:hypothetical protein